ncbi:MAG: type II secretion system protein [Phycisphaerae bacterium]|nr:type II secretion system protein [Phycisphaerae bacterium]
MRPPHPSDRRPIAATASHCERGFTLVEILVVVAILVILLGLVVGIGSWAVEGARARDTRTLLSILDTAAEQFKEDSARTLGRKQEFAIRYGGYPPDELDAFLDIPKANDDPTGVRISRVEFPQTAWQLLEYKDIRAMSLAVRHCGSSPEAEATLDRIDSRFKATLLGDGGIPTDYWDVDEDDGAFKPEIDEPLEYYVDSWSNPVAYFSTRGVTAGPSSDRVDRAVFSSYLIRSFSNGRPVFVSYGPDGAEQQPGSELWKTDAAQDLVKDYKDDQKINNKYNYDNIYSVDGLEKKLVQP